MRKIISSIDIGSSSIKLIVGEFVNERLNILSATKIDSGGIENGKVISKEHLTASIKTAVKEASSTLGVDIKKIILGINPNNIKLVKSYGEIKIKREDKTITGKDINEVIQRCSDGKIDEGYSLLGTIPVDFGVQNDRITKNPKGLESDILALKGIVVTSNKDELRDLVSAAEDAGLKIIDVMPNGIGDYQVFKNRDTELSVCAVVNIGYETTTISIFNRGILTNMKTLNLGVENIISDIAYIKRLDMSIASALYKDIALGSADLSSPNEYRMVKNLDDENIKIEQVEISEICTARIVDMLKLIKNQINTLTKKEISYIIFSGGLSELKDFNLTLNSEMGSNTKIGVIDLIGARDNSYASAIGIIKYFNEKISLRGKTFSMLAPNEAENINKEDEGNKEDSLLGKVFGYFFDS